MARYHGPQLVGAAERTRGEKRREAQARQASYQEHVEKIMREQRIGHSDARWAAAVSRRTARAVQASRDARSLAKALAWPL